MLTSTSTLLGLDAGEWEALGVWVTAGITVLLLAFAWWQFHDARALRIEQARPTVVVDASFRDTLIRLMIHNTGRTTARNVRIRFEEPPTSSCFELLWLTGPAFTAGMQSLSPGRKLEYKLDTFPNRIKAGLPLIITGAVSYDLPHGIRGPRYSEPFVIDLESHRETLHADKTMHDLVGRVTEIRDELRKWSK